MENLNTKIPNGGVIEVMPRFGDFISGGESGTVASSINTACDWRVSEPAGEWQRDMVSLFETDACVSFAHNDTKETYGDFCIKSGLWDKAQDDIAWLRDNGYFTADGRLNFSDRFLAKVSGTTTAGNSLPNVANAAGNLGLIPESMWPFPLEEIRANPSDAWNIYYAEPTGECYLMGQEFKKRFGQSYEWVSWPGSGSTPASLRSELAKGPLQIATAVCMPWNTDAVISACGAGTAHSTMLANVELEKQFDILDHYEPFEKHFAVDYDITYSLRLVWYPKVLGPTQPAGFRYTFTKQLTYTYLPTGGFNRHVFNDVNELHALQTALQTLKRNNGVPYMKPGVFGPFGPQTRAALDMFERDHFIVDPEPGENFGPKNRAAMNAALLANK